MFSVTDSGVGIAPDAVPHVFDRFWQATTRARRLGAGLGLPITKGIVEAHGGRIGVESEVGRGTTFFFTIPASQRSAVIGTASWRRAATSALRSRRSQRTPPRSSESPPDGGTHIDYILVKRRHIRPVRSAGCDGAARRRDIVRLTGSPVKYSHSIGEFSGCPCQLAHNAEIAFQSVLLHPPPLAREFISSYGEMSRRSLAAARRSASPSAAQHHPANDDDARRQNDQYRRNFARAVQSVATSRISVRKTESVAARRVGTERPCRSSRSRTR